MRTIVTDKIEPNSARARCFYCDTWITPSSVNWGMCDVHLAHFLARMQREQNHRLTTLRQYSEETGDPSGAAFAQLMEDEDKNALEGDFSFLRRDPKTELAAIGFDPKKFQEWHEDHIFGSSPDKEKDDGLTWD
jgi:hypothetical protein